MALQEHTNEKEHGNEKMAETQVLKLFFEPLIPLACCEGYRLSFSEKLSDAGRYRLFSHVNSQNCSSPG